MIAKKNKKRTEKNYCRKIQTAFYFLQIFQLDYILFLDQTFYIGQVKFIWKLTTDYDHSTLFFQLLVHFVNILSLIHFPNSFHFQLDGVALELFLDKALAGSFFAVTKVEGFVTALMISHLQSMDVILMTSFYCFSIRIYHTDKCNEYLSSKHLNTNFSVEKRIGSSLDTERQTQHYSQTKIFVVIVGHLKI